MNDFMDQLEDDLNDNFFNLDEFAEEIIYRPSAGPEVTIQGLFDFPSTSVASESEVDVIDNRPHMTIKESDIPGGKLKSTDRFIIRGIEYEAATNDGANGQQVIRAFLYEV